MLSDVLLKNISCSEVLAEYFIETKGFLSPGVSYSLSPVNIPNGISIIDSFVFLQRFKSDTNLGIGRNRPTNEHTILPIGFPGSCFLHIS